MLSLVLLALQCVGFHGKRHASAEPSDSPGCHTTGVRVQGAKTWAKVQQQPEATLQMHKGQCTGCRQNTGLCRCAVGLRAEELHEGIRVPLRGQECAGAQLTSC